MMQEVPPNMTTRDDGAQWLRRSRFAVGCVFVFCVLLCGFSAVVFTVQVFHEDEFGQLFRDQPRAWPHLLGHLLRCVVGAGLAWCLWKYLRALQKLTDAEQRDASTLFQALAR